MTIKGIISVGNNMMLMKPSLEFMERGVRGQAADVCRNQFLKDWLASS